VDIVKGGCEARAISGVDADLMNSICRVSESENRSMRM
jgi:hypothetical protein